jgi:hypothetical protein
MKQAFMLLLAVGFLLLTGCASKPMSTAKKYFKALSAQDYQAAKKYVAPASQETFDSLFEFSDEKHTYKAVRAEQEGEDTARVYYTVDGEDTDKYIDLERIDGVWMITLPSDDK